MTSPGGVIAWNQTAPTMRVVDYTDDKVYAYTDSDGVIRDTSLTLQPCRQTTSDSTGSVGRPTCALWMMSDDDKVYAYEGLPGHLVT